MIPFGYFCNKSCKSCFYHFECYGIMLNVKKKNIYRKTATINKNIECCFFSCIMNQKLVECENEY